MPRRVEGFNSQWFALQSKDDKQEGDRFYDTA